MTHNLHCSSQGRNKPHLLYRQNYTRWDIWSKNTGLVVVGSLQSLCECFGGQFH